jgi:hypothetical protein
MKLNQLNNSYGNPRVSTIKNYAAIQSVQSLYEVNALYRIYLSRSNKTNGCNELNWIFRIDHANSLQGQDYLRQNG